MDPTANLKEQLEIARSIIDGTCNASFSEFFGNEPDRLAELVLALHEWIIQGGEVPEQWRKSGGF